MKKISQHKKYVNPERQKLSENKEKLRTAKKVWNSNVKDFISELIELKQLINGRPKSGDKIRLYQPLPEEALDKISNIERNLSEKTNQAKSIFDFQKGYSEQYNQFYGELEKKRQENKKASDNDYNLVAEGISPLSLKWQQFKSFFSPKDSDDSHRMTLLNQLYNFNISNVYELIITYITIIANIYPAINSNCRMFYDDIYTNYAGQGREIPPDITTPIIMNQIQILVEKHKNIIIDGFPRDIYQYHALFSYLLK